MILPPENVSGIATRLEKGFWYCHQKGAANKFIDLMFSFKVDHIKAFTTNQSLSNYHLLTGLQLLGDSITEVFLKVLSD